jgi:phenylpyruvate tautomerase PptA (4-oxalocrotonate tautomerase family)
MSFEGDEIGGQPMPVLEVTVVGGGPASTRAGLARGIADAAGAVFQSTPGSTWVVLREHPAEDYAENAAGPEEGYAPVFVRVLKKSLPSERELAREVEALTRAVAEVCGRDPEQVHVIYEPPAEGRTAFGGRLIT